jgi:hypothetical protein
MEAIPTGNLRERKAPAVKAPWRNLVGPSRTLAISATVLLIASGLGGAEAATLLILGPALSAGPVDEYLLKPFVILAYLEVCAIFFSVLGIVLSIVCLMFYNPYLLIRDKIRAHRRSREEEEMVWDGPVFVAPGHYREEDGAPD